MNKFNDRSIKAYLLPALAAGLSFIASMASAQVLDTTVQSAQNAVPTTTSEVTNAVQAASHDSRAIRPLSVTKSYCHNVNTQFYPDAAAALSANLVDDGTGTSTCTAACTPVTRAAQSVGACPAGQVGSITYARDLQCPSNNLGSTYYVSDSCQATYVATPIPAPAVAAPDPIAVINPVAVTGGGGTGVVIAGSPLPASTCGFVSWSEDFFSNRTASQMACFLKAHPGGFGTACNGADFLFPAAGYDGTYTAINPTLYKTVAGAISVQAPFEILGGIIHPLFGGYIVDYTGGVMGVQHHFVSAAQNVYSNDNTTFCGYVAPGA